MRVHQIRRANALESNLPKANLTPDQNIFVKIPCGQSPEARFR
jgi:hypothetical protein